MNSEHDSQDQTIASEVTRAKRSWVEPELSVVTLSEAMSSPSDLTGNDGSGYS